ncbi:MAG: LysM peptidoglycan-binding domain-containing protein [Actinomycetota bacterium]
MADPLTDRFETYDPDDETYASDDEDYVWEEETDARGPKPNVLWGRVAILAGLVLLAFLFGRMTAGGGVPAADLDRAQDRIEELRTENAQLKTEIAAQEQDDPGAAEAPAETEDSEEAETAESQDQTYTVQSGDSLTTIAQRFYNDASLDDFLAEANDISDPTKLSVGQELRIPPKPE